MWCTLYNGTEKKNPNSTAQDKDDDGLKAHTHARIVRHLTIHGVCTNTKSIVEHRSIYVANTKRQNVCVCDGVFFPLLK